MMCICCDKKISLLMPEMENGKTEEEIVFIKETVQLRGKRKEVDTIEVRDAGFRNWRDGIVNLISAGYGSIHDGDEFIIAVCDDCITKKKMTGNIAYINNYLGYCMPDDEDFEKSRIAWRRYNMIDDIINGE